MYKRVAGFAKANKKLLKWYAAGLSVMFLAFTANITGVGPTPYWFSEFQKDSEAIVNKTVDCRNEKNEVGYDGPVMPQKGQQYAVMYENGCGSKNYRPYDAQFGLQAHLIAFFSPAKSEYAKQYFATVKFLLALVFALVLMGFVYCIQRAFGTMVAASVYTLLIFSPWIVGYARNMYWVIFLMFLPFVFSFGFYSTFKARQKLLLFYAILGVLFALKFLNGYEHLTTMIFSAFIPIVYFELMRGRRLIELWRQALAVLLVGMAGFAAAFLINVVSLNTYYHSWSQSVHAVIGRAKDRSESKKMQANVVVGFQATLPDVYRIVDEYYELEKMADGSHAPYRYVVLSLFNYALLPAVTLPFGAANLLVIVVQSIFTMGVLAWLLLRYLRRNKGLSKQVETLKYVYLLSLAGSLSWLVLMPGHAFPHAHLNAIIFYVPFLLICYVIIGLALRERFAKRLKKYGW